MSKLTVSIDTEDRGGPNDPTHTVMVKDGDTPLIGQNFSDYGAAVKVARTLREALKLGTRYKIQINRPNGLAERHIFHGIDAWDALNQVPTSNQPALYISVEEDRNG